MKEFLHVLSAEIKKALLNKSAVAIFAVFLVIYLAISLIFTVADDETSEQILSNMSGFRSQDISYFSPSYLNQCDGNRISLKNRDVEIARQIVGNIDEDDSLIYRYKSKLNYNLEKKSLAIMKHEINNGVETQDMTETALFSQVSLSIFQIIAVIGTIAVGASVISSAETDTISPRPIKRWKLLTCKFFSVMIYGLIMYALGLIFTFLLGGLIFGFDGFNYTFVRALGPDAVLAASVIPYTVISAALSFTQIILFISMVFLTYCLFKSSTLAAVLPILVYLVSYFMASPIAMLDIAISKYLIFFNLDLSSFLYSYAPLHTGLTIMVSAVIIVVHFVVFMALSYILFARRNFTSSGTMPKALSNETVHS